ncbi:MAG: dTDP-4-dehydrorhamnose reductase [Pseudobdellovibrionaceae bacterium]|nr:MAG: dTDP-4-dehydrorhamnose reductase [Pseudobdellovibrionaceae bacterium]
MALSNRRPILIFGSTGQVGQHLCDLLGSQAVGASSAMADFTKPDTILNTLQSTQPAMVINAAAYTAVDRAESEKELAQQINAIAPGLIADFCASHGIPMVHYSTDYVFSGKKSGAYREDDFPDPVNVYGKTKFEGERRIEKALGKHLIFRTSWVYSEYGHNFVKTMLRLGAERESLKIVNDQTGCPTSARDIAVATTRAIDRALGMASFPSGIYNMTGSDHCTWYEFATDIFASAKQIGFPSIVKNIEPTTTDEYPTAATRPLNSVLNNDKLEQQFKVKLPSWHKSLQSVLEKIYEN